MVSARGLLAGGDPFTSAIGHPDVKCVQVFVGARKAITQVVACYVV